MHRGHLDLRPALRWWLYVLRKGLLLDETSPTKISMPTILTFVEVSRLSCGVYLYFVLLSCGGRGIVGRLEASGYLEITAMFGLCGFQAPQFTRTARTKSGYLYRTQPFAYRTSATTSCTRQRTRQRPRPAGGHKYISTSPARLSIQHTTRDFPCTQQRNSIGNLKPIDYPYRGR